VNLLMSFIYILQIFPAKLEFGI